MKRFLCIVLLLMLVLSSVPAFAAHTAVQDGMSVTLITDKDVYAAGEPVEAVLRVQNLHDADIRNVRTEIKAPHNVRLMGGGKARLPHLKAHETHEHTDVLHDGSTPDLPHTGDSAHIGLWLALLTLSFAGCVCLIAIRRPKAGSRWLSLLLCVVLVGSGLPAHVHAETQDKTITVSKQVTVDGQPTDITGTVTYSADVAVLTVANYMINEMAEDIKVHVGDMLTLSGVITAPADALLSGVQVLIYEESEEEPYTVGEEYFSFAPAAMQYDLALVPQMIVGEPFGESEFALMEGGRYVVMLRAADSKGSAFADSDAEAEGLQGPQLSLRVLADPANCDHSSKEYTYERDYATASRVTYTGSDTSHLVEPAYKRYCADCGTFLMNIWGEGEEAWHTMKDGMCTECGYTAEVMMMAANGTVCTHQTITDGTPFTNYLYSDAENHIVQKVYTGFCAQCDLGTNQTVIVEEPEAHSFDSTGKCSLCQYVKDQPCAHNNTSETVMYSYEPFAFDEYYNTVNSTKHLTEEIHYTDCYSCGARLSYDKQSYLETHEYDSNGICKQCDHVEGTDVSYDGCWHSSETYTYGPMEYEQYDATTHRITQIAESSTCNECGKVLDHENISRRLGQHVFSNGECTLCGYIGESSITSLSTPVLHQTSYSVKTNQYVTVSWDAIEHAEEYYIDIYDQEWEGIIYSTILESSNTSYSCRFENAGDYRIILTAKSGYIESDSATATVSVIDAEMVETDTIKLGVSKIAAPYGEYIDFIITSDTDEIVIVMADSNRGICETLNVFHSDSTYRSSHVEYNNTTLDFYVLSSDGRKSNTVTVGWYQAFCYLTASHQGDSKYHFGLTSHYSSSATLYFEQDGTVVHSVNMDVEDPVIHSFIVDYTFNSVGTKNVYAITDDGATSNILTLDITEDMLNPTLDAPTITTSDHSAVAGEPDVINWTAVDGAEGYTIAVYKNKQTVTSDCTISYNGCSASIIFPSEGVYVVQAAAKKDGYNAAWSNGVNVTVTEAEPEEEVELSVSDDEVEIGDTLVITATSNADSVTLVMTAEDGSASTVAMTQSAAGTFVHRLSASSAQSLTLHAVTPNGTESNKVTVTIYCPHTSSTDTYNPNIQPVYSNITETHHDVSSGYTPLCDECGEPTGANGYFDAVTQEHTFEDGVCVCGASENPAEDKLAAPVPAQASMTAIRGEQVTIRWNASAGAERYGVWFYDTNPATYVDAGTNLYVTHTFEHNSPQGAPFSVQVYALAGTGADQQQSEPGVISVTVECGEHDYSDALVYTNTLFKPVDDEYHLAYADVYSVTCTECGATNPAYTIERDPEDYEQDKHAYDAKGMCQSDGCGHECLDYAVPVIAKVELTPTSGQAGDRFTLTVTTNEATEKLSAINNSNTPLKDGAFKHTDTKNGKKVWKATYTAEEAHANRYWTVTPYNGVGVAGGEMKSNKISIAPSPISTTPSGYYIDYSLNGIQKGNTAQNASVAVALSDMLIIEAYNNGTDVTPSDDNEFYFSTIFEPIFVSSYGGFVLIDKEGAATIHLYHESIVDEDGDPISLASLTVMVYGDVVEKINEFANHCDTVSIWADKVQERNLYTDVVLDLFTKGTDALSDEIKRLAGSKGIIEDEELMQIVEIMVLAEMDEVEYITNTAFASVVELSSNAVDTADDINEICKDFFIDPQSDQWLTELGEAIATYEGDPYGFDAILEKAIKLKKAHAMYSTGSEIVGGVNSFLEWLNDMQEGKSTYQMRSYIQAEAKEHLDALAAGFSDPHMVEVIRDYQKKAENALANLVIEQGLSTAKGLKDGFVSYCKVVEGLKDAGVFKHLPKEVSAYTKAEKAFKEFKIGGKFKVEDIKDGMKIFDAIAAVEGLFGDGKGFVNSLDILEREHMALETEIHAFENELNTNYSHSGNTYVFTLTKAQVSSRINALGSLCMATLNSLEDVVEILRKMYEEEAIGTLAKWFARDDYEQALKDIPNILEEIATYKQTTQTLQTDLQTAIETCINFPD